MNVGPVELVVLLIVPVALVLFVVSLARRSGNDVVAEWASSRGLVLTPANRPMVAWYLENARSLRWLGAIGGIVLPPLVALALGFRIKGVPTGWVWVFAGYLVGALYAEAALVRPARAACARAAALLTRDLRDYLPGRRLWAQRGLGVVGVVVAVAAALVAYPDEPNAFRPIVAGAVVGGVAAGVLGVVLEALQRWVGRRPQPVSAPDLVAADDAIRSQSVHSILGSGIAVQLLLVSPAFMALASSDVQVLRWTMWVPSVFGWVAAVWACLWFGHRTWTVRRVVPPVPARA